VLAGAAPLVAAPALVQRIEVRSEVALTAAEIEPLLVVRVGEPLSEEAARRTLRNLRLSGVAAEAELWLRPDPAGAVAVVALWPEVRVARVEIEGETGLRRERLRAVVPQRVGEPLREDRVLRGVYRLGELLSAEGFREARVRVEVTPPSPERTVDVTYRIEPGSRSILRKVTVEGAPPNVPSAEVRGALKLSPGDPDRPATLRDARERLQRFFYRLGYGTAEVDPPTEQRDGANVDLVWTVRPGPRVELEIDGADRKILAKRGLFPFLGDAGYDEALVLQSVAQIRRYFQERGYYYVDVSQTETRDGAAIHLQFAIAPGRRYRLERLEFSGDTSYSRDALQKLMATERRRLLAPGSGRLVDEVLSEDLSNLRSFYALEGFYRARVGPAEIAANDDRLRVTIPIDEGPRRVIDSVSIRGLQEISEAEARSQLGLSPGQGFHPFHVDAAIDRLRALLDGRGFRSAIVSSEVAWPATDHAAVELRVLEGERSLVQTIVVRGDPRTRKDLVRRFLGIEVGQPISSQALLEAQRALYGLGVFSEVRVTAPIADGEFESHQVVVDVAKGRSRSLVLGAGWDSETGVRGLLRLAALDLGGRLATLQLDTLLSDKQQDVRLIYRQPYLGPWMIESRALAFFEQEQRPGFDVRRRGVGAGLSKQVASWRLGLYANYRLVDENLVESTATVPREDTEARVASVTWTTLYDRRDDPVDPTRGWSAYVEAEHAVPFGQADADFTRVFGQLTGLAGIGKAGSLAASVRVGRLFPRSAAPPEGEPLDAVPVSELFYAGGRTTHRAFRRDELGILGATLALDDHGDPVPLGGGALALANLDWRFPLFGALGGVAFVDAGNVWRHFGDLSSADVRIGAGVGLRYKLPFGPLRLEVGWKLDREPFEDPYVVSLTLGNAF